MKIIGITSLTLIAAYGIWFTSHSQGITPTSNFTVQFEGDFLAISDADMIGGAYANGILNKVPGIEDSLTYISSNSGQLRIQSQQHASNSVVSWPSIIAMDKTSKYVYVAETKGIYTAKIQKVKNVWEDLPTGKKISVFDYSSPGSPQLRQEKKVGENIGGVSLNKNQTLLAATSTTQGQEIIISQLENGLLTEVFHFPIQDLPKVKDSKISTVEFHPEQDVIAINYGDEYVLFYRIHDKNPQLSIAPIGAPLKVAKHWSVGNWHPNGRYFILSDVAWGNGNLGFILNGKGKLISVEFAPNGRHQIVSKVKVGLSPEGFDISPNGQYAVTVNMRRTWAPPKGYGFVPGKKMASLSLIKIDPTTGQLQKLGKDYPFTGALPEDAIFDAASNSIAVTVYHERANTFPKQGWIDFWELKDGALIYTDQQLKLTRGVHNLLLVK